MFKRILIANRGEIAVRIARTCRELGIETVTVYSDADRRGLHVLEADGAVYIGPAPAAQSYLNIGAIIKAATESGAEAIHPGYGLLSENADLAEACARAGIVFIGPPPSAIRLMGNKAEARRLADSSGVPTVPGYEGDSQTPAQLLAQARKIGFPVMVKAAMGGGGRGMRMVGAEHEFDEAIESARREAERAFGDGRLLLERAIIGARHVEVQVLGDSNGNIVHLGERDCSVQRRHQKVIEESPSPAVDDALRARMGEAAVALARAANYVSAGTVEFLLGVDGNFYFLEMNTRLQVEHGVTEMVTGLDLVALQLAIAAGEPLPFSQGGVNLNGHTVECRLYAEDALKSYLPSAGAITELHFPSGEGIRVDPGTYAGDEISTFYDAMIAKLLAHGKDREAALRRMRRALADTYVAGVHTNIALLQAVLAHHVFESGRATTDFLELQVSPQTLVGAPPDGALMAAFGHLVLGPTAESDPWRASGPWRTGGAVRIELVCEGAAQTIEGRRVAGSAREWLIKTGAGEHAVRFSADGTRRVIVERDGRSETYDVLRTGRGLQIRVGGDRSFHFEWSFGQAHAGAADHHRQRGLTSPMPGLVLKVLVRPGEKVHAHQTLIVLEAMKMEHAIEAPYDGVVKQVHCAEGGRVPEGVVLIELDQKAAK